MHSFCKSLLCALVAFASPIPAGAGSLQASTVLLEVVAPGAATAFTLRNTGEQTTSAQIRVFKWTQSNGTETLALTDEVVASPPFANLRPGQDYTVRIVRVNPQPVFQEEAYRLLVDEVPQPARNSGIGLRFALRYSLPLFFGPAVRGNQKLIWSAANSHGILKITVRNSSSKRVRIASLKLMNPGGETVVAKDGLLGYALGNSEMTWSVPVPGKGLLSGSALIAADTDSGPIHDTVTLNNAP